jgi:hypothetical protein
MGKSVSFDELIEMARNYGVAENALFISAARQYEIQAKVIAKIEAVLDESDPVVKKSYVKEVENLYSNPMVKELPKHSDSANKTLGVMLDIITKLGHKVEETDELEEMSRK